jgi:hypothetical protein
VAVHSVCIECSDDTTCTKITCDQGFEDKNNDATDGCELASQCIIGSKGLPGTIACMNAGIATGVTGSCGCSCSQAIGYSGTRCEIAETCSRGSANTPGIINCLNGGTAIGVTGNCTCQCQTGFSGTFCKVANSCSIGSANTPGVIDCLNGGIARGTTGNCGCTCLDSFVGDKCGLKDFSEELSICRTNETVLASTMKGVSKELTICRDTEIILVSTNIIITKEVTECKKNEVNMTNQITLCRQNKNELVSTLEAHSIEWNELIAQNNGTTNNLNDAKETILLLQRKIDEYVVELSAAAKVLAAKETTTTTTTTKAPLSAAEKSSPESLTQESTSHAPTPAAASISCTTTKTVTKLEQRNLKLEGTVKRYGEIVMALSGLLFFCLAVLTILCCRCLTRKKTQKIVSTETLSALENVGKFGQFMDRNHDAIKKIGHHDHAVSVQKMSRVHSRRKVEKIQKNQFHAKGRLMARLKQRAEASNAMKEAQKIAGTGSSSTLIVPEGAVISISKTEQKKMDKKLEKQKRKEEKRAQKRASKVAAKGEKKKRKKSLKKEEDVEKDMVVRVEVAENNGGADPQVVLLRTAMATMMKKSNNFDRMIAKSDPHGRGVLSLQKFVTLAGKIGTRMHVVPGSEVFKEVWWSAKTKSKCPAEEIEHGILREWLGIDIDVVPKIKMLVTEI